MNEKLLIFLVKYIQKYELDDIIKHGFWVDGSYKDYIKLCDQAVKDGHLAYKDMTGRAFAPRNKYYEMTEEIKKVLRTLIEL